MKIVHLIAKIGRGGAPMMLLNLLAKLSGEQDEHLVIGLRNDNKLKKEFTEIEVQTETMGLNKDLFLPKGILSLKERLQEIEPDIIHSWMYHSNVIASLIGPKNTKIIWSTHHSLDDLENEKWLTKLAIRIGPFVEKKVSKHIYCSKTSRVQHKKFGYLQGKTKVIPNGFNIDLFKPDASSKIEFRDNYNLPSDSIVFGQAARYHPLKNQEWLIKNFAKVQQKYPSTYLILAGDGINHENKSLMDLIYSLKMSDKVRLIGEYSNMPAFLNGIDCYCSSSLSEAFPMVLGEAMACGTPCICTDVGDSSYIIGKKGWTVNVYDDESYINSMFDMVDLTDKKYKELGLAARERIKNKFSLESVAQRYYNSYLNCIN